MDSALYVNTHKPRSSPPMLYVTVPIDVLYSFDPAWVVQTV